MKGLKQRTTTFIVAVILLALCHVSLETIFMVSAGWWIGEGLRVIWSIISDI